MAPKTATKTIKKQPEYSFYKHQTFHIRDVWLHKGIKILNDDPKSLSAANEPHHILGVGKNMVDSIRYWMQATGLATLDEGTKGGAVPLLTTKLANLIFESDPYFEESVTLWLTHIELASNKKLATLWYWIFNEYGVRDFNSERITNSLKNIDGIVA